MLEMTVREFLSALASDAPAPGGGSAAALAGALAAALTAMVANLTRGKEKFAGVEAKMSALADQAAELRDGLAQLVEEDTAAFNRVMAALRQPKDTPEAKAAREAAIQAALAAAAEVPLRTAEAAVSVLGLAQEAATYGNPAAASDAGVAALLARAAVEGAALNVDINLASLKDPERRAELSARKERALTAARGQAEQVLMRVAVHIHA